MSRRPAAAIFLGAFKEEMIKVFDLSVYGHKAFRRLVTLRQGRRLAADYALEFCTLATTCECNEQALSTRFLEGLSGEIKEEIFSHEPPTHLDQLVELAIHLDKHFELHRHTHLSSPEPREAPPVISPASVAPPGHEPMQLGGLHISTAERQHRIVERLCMYYGSQGHYVARCPVKDSSPVHRELLASMTSLSPFHKACTTLTANLRFRDSTYSPDRIRS